MELQSTPQDTCQEPDMESWTRMLAAARGADEIKSPGPLEIYKYPLTEMRLPALLPVARDLYEKAVRLKTKVESRRIYTVVVHCCQGLRGATELSEQSDAEPWETNRCESEAKNLLVPFALTSLQPVPPEVIGVALLPQSPAWRLLGDQMRLQFSEADKRLWRLYARQILRKLKKRHIKPWTVQPLRNVTLVNEVLARAPPLVQKLPAHWTSPDLSDDLHEALQALLEMRHVRPLANLVEQLSPVEYNVLAEERRFLSQLLDEGTWTPSGGNGRNLTEYMAFVRHLQQECDFQGRLARLPVKPQIAPESCAPDETQTWPFQRGKVARRRAKTLLLKRMRLERNRWLYLDKPNVWDSLQAPTKTDMAAWARMLAAARGADAIQTDGFLELGAHPLTRGRLDTLLPVARELHDEIVVPRALNESQLIASVIAHCHKHLGAAESRDPEQDAAFQQRAEIPWSKEQCERAAGELPVPFSLKTLRPTPPEAIGFNLIPHVSAWCLLSIVLNARFSLKVKRFEHLYRVHVHDAVTRGCLAPSAVRPLGNVAFVGAVLARAPPLVRAFPPQWTAADATDDLLEALQALLRLWDTRPLADLVAHLSDDEYAVLVDERLCLSQLLNGDSWHSCSKGRSVDADVAFVGVLRQCSGFEGFLAAVPPKARETRSASGTLSNTGPASLADDPPPAVAVSRTGEPELVQDEFDRRAGVSAKRQRIDGGAQPLSKSWSSEQSRRAQSASTGADSDFRIKRKTRLPAPIPPQAFSPPRTYNGKEPRYMTWDARGRDFLTWATLLTKALAWTSRFANRFCATRQTRLQATRWTGCSGCRRWSQGQHWNRRASYRHRYVDVATI